MGKRVAHEVDAALLPGGVHDLGDHCLDAQMGIGGRELDAAQPAKGQLSHEAGLECLGSRSAYVHAESFVPPIIKHLRLSDQGNRELDTITATSTGYRKLHFEA